MSDRGGRIVVRLSVAVAALSGSAALLVGLLAGAPALRIAFGVLGALASSTFLARVVLRVQLQSLGHLERRVQTLERDDWEGSNGGSSGFRSDELGQLANAFEDLVVTLRTERSRLEQHSVGLESQVVERTLHLQRANERLAELDLSRTRVLEGVGRQLAEPLDEITELLGDLDAEREFEDETLQRVMDAADRLNRELAQLRS